MNDRKSYLLATVGIVSLVASLTLNIARASNTEASTLPASTSHFAPGKVYILSPANGTGNFNCKVTEVDGAWLNCEGSNNRWTNSDAMLYAVDSR
jgi:hypothetical protein